MTLLSDTITPEMTTGWALAFRIVTSSVDTDDERSGSLKVNVICVSDEPMATKPLAGIEVEMT
jgi:hypothetical protein